MISLLLLYQYLITDTLSIMIPTMLPGAMLVQWTAFQKTSVDEIYQTTWHERLDTDFITKILLKTCKHTFMCKIELPFMQKFEVLDLIISTFCYFKH